MKKHKCLDSSLHHAYNGRKQVVRGRASGGDTGDSSDTLRSSADSGHFVNIL